MKDKSKFWDKMAKNYDASEEKDSQTFKEVIKSTKKYLKENDIVLDFGCGTGKTIVNIAGDVSEVHAIDISSKMIDVAKEKIESMGLKNVRLDNLDIFDRQLKEDSYDVIISFHVLHLLEDLDSVLKRVHSLLKKDGLFISVTPCMGEKRVLNGLLRFLGRFGLVPKVNSFKRKELLDATNSVEFEHINVSCLNEKTMEMFIVTKKKEIN